MEYARNLLDFSKDVESKYRGAPKFFRDNQCMVIVWIWSTNRLQRTRNILKSCFPQHHQKFHVIVGQEACQKTDILIGYQFVYHKNLDRVWRIFHDLDGNNTLIFDDSLYNVMWNMPGTYLIFPKL